MPKIEREALIQELMQSRISQTEASTSGVQRAERFMRETSAAIRRHQRMVERRIVFGLVIAASLFIGLNWYTRGAVMRSVARTFYSLDKPESTGWKQLDCSDPRNTRLPYCQDSAGATNQLWRSMSVTEGGKVNQFKLSDKK